MTTETTASRATARVAAFLDAFEDPAHPYHGTINTLRSEGLTLMVADLRAVLGELERLRGLTNPPTWTAPDGAVLDLSRQIFDRDGDAWHLDELPPLTVAMVDGDLGPKALPHLFDLLGPLTNDGQEV